MIDWPRTDVMSQMLRPNLSLCVGRAGSAADNQEWNVVFCAKTLVDMNLFYRGGNVSYPLRFKATAGSFDFDQSPRPNFKAPFLRILAETLGLPQRGEFSLPEDLAPEGIFHYIYALLHSPVYRTRYADFLKIDFPRLLLTSSRELFVALACLGADLIALHLLEDDYPPASWNQGGCTRVSPLKQPMTAFVERATGTTMGAFSKRSCYQEGRVYLDTSQCSHSSYFDGVPEEAWNFHIGGYQVLHKWLYDRRGTRGQPGRTLTEEDIAHYQRIVVALKETIRLMGEIDEAIDVHGGWPIE
jgi:predicted helicase